MAKVGECDARAAGPEHTFDTSCRPTTPARTTLDTPAHPCAGLRFEGCEAVSGYGMLVCQAAQDMRVRSGAACGGGPMAGVCTANHHACWSKHVVGNKRRMCAWCRCGQRRHLPAASSRGGRVCSRTMQANRSHLQETPVRECGDWGWGRDQRVTASDADPWTPQPALAKSAHISKGGARRRSPKWAHTARGGGC